MKDDVALLLEALAEPDRTARLEIATTQDALLYELYGLSAASAVMAEQTEALWRTLCAFANGAPVHEDGNDPAATAALLKDLLEGVRSQNGLWAGVPYLVLDAELRSVWDEGPDSLPTWLTVEDLALRSGSPLT